MDPQARHDSWLRLKLHEIDAVERRIGSVRPRGQLRRRVLILYLLALAIGAGVVVSTNPSILSTSAFGLLLFSALATCAAIVSPRHRLRALEWRRDELLEQIGHPPADDDRELGL